MVSSRSNGFFTCNITTKRTDVDVFMVMLPDIWAWTWTRTWTWIDKDMDMDMEMDMGMHVAMRMVQAHVYV